MLFISLVNTIFYIWDVEKPEDFFHNLELNEENTIQVPHNQLDNSINMYKIINKKIRVSRNLKIC